jgi:subtilisin-like proprotein convertase family protein
MKHTITLFFALLVSTLTFAQTFTAVGNDTITDDSHNNFFSINVAGLTPATLNHAHGLVKVCLNITHTYDADLEAAVISPDGTTTMLLNHVGGGNDNFTNTCFTATAATLIGSANAPFTGTFRANLGTLNNGSDGNGQWQLRVLDNGPQDVGVLRRWSVTFDTAAAITLPLVSNLPILVINTNGQAIVDDPKINATMRLVSNSTGAMNTATDTVNVTYNGNIGIEIRGNYSAILPQKPYAFETRDAAQNQLDTTLLGMPKEHDWALLANYNDKVFIRNTLAYKLSADMGNYAPRTRHCEVVLNGEYMGVYILCETIKRGKKRVNIAKIDTSMNVSPAVTGGYIIKNDIFDGSNGWLLTHHPLDVPALNVHLIYQYPKPANITTAQKNYLHDYIDEFENVLYGANFADPVTGYRKYIDVPSFLDYFMMAELTRNNDGFKKSCYFHKDRATTNDKLKAGPVWDFDWAWKNINECPEWSVTDGSGWSYHVNQCGPDAPSTAWNVRLLQDTAYANELHCRWAGFRQNVLDTTTLFHYIDSMATYLNAAQARHFDRWQNLGSDTGSPEMTHQPDTFEGCILQFKQWIAQRLTWLDANMYGSCPVVATQNAPIPTQNFIIAPNPATDNIVLYLPKGTTYPQTATFYDPLGRAVLTAAIANDAPTISTKTLANGIYTVVVMGANTAQKSRVVIAR